jgi:hypothetical protein
MRITVEELFNVGKTFGSFLEKEIPMKTSLKMRRLNKAIGEEVEIHDPERVKIFENVGCELKDNKFDVPKLQKESPEKYAELITKLNEFNAQEIDLKFEPFKAEDFGEITVKPAILILLEKFIED